MVDFDIFNVDTAIITVFLIVNFTAGLFFSSGKTTLREYAVGNKKFSTGTIAATVIATCIGGGFFSGAITESYRQGLYFIIPALGEPLALIIIGYFLIPRMAEFLGDLSVADAMGNLYGKHVRIIVAISGIILCIGVVALQFKVGAAILGVFFWVSGFYATLLCAIIVTVYSAFGGIKAVTFTDIIQFFTFGTIIPIISLSIWGTLNDPYVAFTTLTENPLFDYKQVFDFSNDRFISTIFLLMFFLVPDFQPVFFQRIIMARNTIQGRNAFIIGGVVCLAMLLIISWVGILLLSDNPNLDPNNLLPYIISTYSYVGLKGLTAVGVMAIIMSSADSYINSAAVLFTNDILKPFNIKKLKLFNELTLACIFSFFVGTLGFFIAFKASTVLKLLLFVFSFYAPIVSAPLLLTIFGFRTTSVPVLMGMAAGSSAVIICNILDINDTIIPDLSMATNTIFLVCFHYLLRQPGGLIGIKCPEPLNLIRAERKRKLYNLVKSIKEFNLMSFFKNNSPKEEYIYSFFGLFCIISVFSTMYSMPKTIQQQNQQVIEFIYHTVLLYSSIFLTYPIWPPILKKEKFIIVAWNIAIPYILLFSPILLVIISNFGQFQLMILMLNMLIIAMLLRWQVAILMIFISVIASIESYKYFLSLDNLVVNIGTLQFKIMYSLLLVSSVLIAFLRPKQEYQELTEQKSDHLSEQVYEIDEELKKSVEIKNEFLRNLEHEAHTPIVGITTMGQVLWDNYDKFTEEQRRGATQEIAKSSERLTSFVNNMIDVSKLSSLNYVLNKKQINLSDLIYQRLDHCKKLYLENKDLEFICDIEEDLLVNCDEHYITSTLDNLIVNAISYSKDGRITIKFKKNKDLVKFKITDEGIGIPQKELYSIFGTFTVSSRTKTPAGGRGLGLALCKGAIEAHKGQIWCKSNGKKGSTFSFTLPIDDCSHFSNP